MDHATSHFDMPLIIRATIWPLFNTDLQLGDQFQFQLSLTAAGKCPEQQSNTSPVKTSSVLLTSNLSQVPDTLWRLLDKGEIIPIYKIWLVVCGPCHSAPSSFVYLFVSHSLLLLLQCPSFCYLDNYIKFIMPLHISSKHPVIFNPIPRSTSRTSSPSVYLCLAPSLFCLSCSCMFFNAHK